MAPRLRISRCRVAMIRPAERQFSNSPTKSSVVTTRSCRRWSRLCRRSRWRSPCVIAGSRLGAVWYEGLTCWMPLRAVHADGRVAWAAEATRALSGMPLEQYVWAGGYRVVGRVTCVRCGSVRECAVSRWWGESPRSSECCAVGRIAGMGCGRGWWRGPSAGRSD